MAPLLPKGQKDRACRAYMYIDPLVLSPYAPFTKSVGELLCKDNLAVQRLEQAIQESLPKIAETGNATIELSAVSHASRNVINKIVHSPEQFRIPEQFIERYEEPLKSISQEWRDLEDEADDAIEEESLMLRRFSTMFKDAYNNHDSYVLFEALASLRDNLEKFERHATALKQHHQKIQARIQKLHETAELDVAGARRERVETEERYEQRLRDLLNYWFSTPSNAEFDAVNALRHNGPLVAKEHFLKNLTGGLDAILDALRHRAKQYRTLLASIEDFLQAISDRGRFSALSLRTYKLIVDAFCRMGFEMTKFRSTEKIARIMWTEPEAASA